MAGQVARRLRRAPVSPRMALHLDARGMHSAYQRRGLNAGPPDFLSQRGSPSALWQLRRNPSSRLDASVQGRDYPDVGDAFLTGRFRLCVPEDAVGEI